jgi:hypothetical protein
MVRLGLTQVLVYIGILLAINQVFGAIDLERGGLSRLEAEAGIRLAIRQSDYGASDYDTLVPLLRAQAYGDFNAQWISCLVNKADSSLLLLFIDEHTRQSSAIPEAYSPGLPMKTKNLLSRKHAFEIVRLTYSNATEPELFVCGSGTCCVDCMSLGNLFWRFFNKLTGEELFLNRELRMVPAEAARRSWFRFADSIRVIKE